MKNSTALISILWLGISIGCSKSDEVTIAAPTLNYEGDLSTKLQEVGSSNVPKIDWNGHKGRFGLENVVTGVSINEKTGKVDWNETLPLQIGYPNEIKVLAFNNGGVTSSSFLIENRFQGKFTGTMDLGSAGIKSLEITFNENGTGTLTQSFIGAPSSKAQGTWQGRSHRISVEHNDPLNVTSYFLQGLLHHSASGTYIEGTIEISSNPGAGKTNRVNNYQMPFFTGTFRVDFS